MYIFCFVVFWLMSHNLNFISEAVGRGDWQLVLNKNMENEDAFDSAKCYLWQYLRSIQ